MFESTFHHDLMRKYTVYFGSLFNDILIQRTTSNNQTQVLKVPLSYAPRNKMMSRLNEFTDLDNTRDIAVQLPRMSFEMITMSYDGSRKLPTMNKVTTLTDSDEKSVNSFYAPVPYNITWLLSIYIKNIEDGTKIIEQILPFFQPDWTETLILVPQVPKPYDIPIALTDISLRDNYEGKSDANRYTVWSLTFEMKAYFVGTVRRRNVIKRAIVDILYNNGNSAIETITVKPGLTANGEPTTSANNSIPYQDIKPTDNYGFIVDIDQGPLQPPSIINP